MTLSSPSHLKVSTKRDTVVKKGKNEERRERGVDGEEGEKDRTMKKEGFLPFGYVPYGDPELISSWLNFRNGWQSPRRVTILDRVPHSLEDIEFCSGYFDRSLHFPKSIFIFILRIPKL